MCFLTFCNKVRVFCEGQEIWCNFHPASFDVTKYGAILIMVLTLLSIFVGFSEYMNFKHTYMYVVYARVLFYMFEFILFFLLKLDKKKSFVYLPIQFQMSE